MFWLGGWRSYNAIHGTIHPCMEVVLIYTFASVLGISIISLTGVITLSLKEEVLHSGMHLFIGLAAGALLGDAFIHLIPKAFEAGIEGATFSVAILGGILFFFVLEKYLRWHNSHKNADHSECRPGEFCAVGKTKPLGTLILVGDGVHNFIDGAIIAASYAVSIPLGIATTIAVALHEIPQEVSDFALLLHSGFRKARALFWNLGSALVAVVGAFAFFAVGGILERIEPLAITFTAGGFIYIAAANLVPELHETDHPGRSALELIAVLIGIALMFSLLGLE